MVKAPQINGENWLNGEKPEMDDQVILVDFWTYSCVNCIRTLPYLQKWHEKYKDKGLIIVGVHTPEFEFEKDEQNVARALKDLGVDWPVVMDNYLEIWRSFANKYWPAKYLINRKGKIVYQHFGEGKYEETEKAIQKLLFNKGDELPELTTEIASAACFRPTPETYLGYARGHIVNIGGYYFDVVENYELEGNVPLDQVGLNGPIKATKEYVELIDHHSEIILHFHATEVNLVLECDEDTELKVLYDDQALAEEMRGGDVDSDSVTHISKARLYNLVKSSIPLDGKLTLKPVKGGIRAYAFTFSGCH